MFLAGKMAFVIVTIIVGLINFVFTVLTVNYVVQDGKSNWLEGFILMCE